MSQKKIPEHGSKVLVLGLGRSGLATASWLKERGIRPVLWDDDPKKRAHASHLGPFYLEDSKLWCESDPVQAIIQSPGISLIHPLTQQALQRAIPVMTDCDLFRLAYPQARIVGVTGTNGKSTTTALIGHLLAEKGWKVGVAGNIGIPVLSLGPEYDIYVWELSSYQLDFSGPLDLEVIAWLNLTPDHLDRHGDLEQYVKAKSRIFLRSPSIQSSFLKSKGVIVRGDEPSHHIFETYKEQVDFYALRLGKPAPSSWPSSHPNEVQKKNLSGEWWLTPEALQDSHGKILLSLSGYPRLQGVHNHQNMAVAYGVCRHLGIVDSLEEAFQTFPGLSHRQEWVAEHEGVVFINDSKATNAEAAAWALSTYVSKEFAPFSRPVYWLAGGMAKAGGIDSLAPYFSGVETVFLFGASQKAFAHTLDQHCTPYVVVESLQEALTAAYGQASQKGRGGVILLSPACASFDQFRDFEDRGNVFREGVFQLLKEKANLEMVRLRP